MMKKLNSSTTTLFKPLGLLALVVVLAIVPLLPVRIPGVFGGAFDTPGTLQLLALCLVFGALAVTYDLLFGYTGLLSFGHALYFAVGVYVTEISMEQLGLGLLPAAGLTATVGLVLPLLLGSICLRVSGIAFAMVTLAFAQAGSILVFQDPSGLTGGEEGLSLTVEQVPGFFVGVFNTANLYWLALAYLVVTYAVARWAVNSPPGRVWQAIRENERRVEVMGFRPYPFKLMVFVLSSFLATMGGVVYLLVVGGANPQVTTATFTLVLLVMVVLGGAGTLWGAALGGVIYQYLDFRLVALSNSETVQGLPAVLRVPLSEPLFILGSLFVVLVVFFPGGLAELYRRFSRGLRSSNGQTLPDGHEEGET